VFALWVVMAMGLPQPTMAQGVGAVGVEVGSTVPLVLERGRFLTPLPFDVQFFLVGDAPDDLVRVRGRFGNRTRVATTCAQVLPPDPAVGQRIEETRPINDGKRKVFELSVDPLQPNKQYCFEFEMFYRVQPEEIQAAVGEGLDLAMRTVFGNEKALGAPSVYDAFRKMAEQMIARIAKMKTAAKGIPIRTVPAPGSFFDPKADINSLPLAVREQFTPALAAQMRQVAALNDINGRRSTARLGAQTLLKDANFVTMVKQVQSRATEPDLALSLIGLTSALTITERGDDLLAAAEGLTAASRFTAPALEQTWTATDITDRLKTIDVTLAELEQLQRLASTLASTPALRTAAQLKLTDGQLKAVATLVGQVRQAFENLRFDMERLQRALGDRQKTILALSDQMSAEAGEIVPFFGTTTSDWETRARQYISADIGLARADPIDSTFFYFGTNIYVGPVNKRAPLPWSDQSFRKRFAFTFGIPLNAFDETQITTQFTNASQTLEGVIGNRPLLIGAGWRLTDLIRATGGIVMFKVKDANPLVDQRATTHFTWYFGLSADWDLKGMFTQSFSGPPRAQPAAPAPAPAPPNE
jgi:hypothetical protein